MAVTPLAFERTDELLHLLHSALDTFCRTDFSRTTQGARFLHQRLTVPRRPEIHPSISRGARARRDHIGG